MLSGSLVFDVDFPTRVSFVKEARHACQISCPVWFRSKDNPVQGKFALKKSAKNFTLKCIVVGIMYFHIIWVKKSNSKIRVMNSDALD